MENEQKLHAAFEAISLVRQALYDFEWMWMPSPESSSYQDMLKQVEIKLNFAKEASSLLPDALNTISEFIKNPPPEEQNIARRGGTTF